TSAAGIRLDVDRNGMRAFELALPLRPRAAGRRRRRRSARRVGRLRRECPARLLFLPQSAAPSAWSSAAPVWRDDGGEVGAEGAFGACGWNVRAWPPPETADTRLRPLTFTVGSSHSFCSVALL